MDNAAFHVNRSRSNDSHPASGKRIWTGRALSGLVALALLFDSAVKLLQLDPAMQGTIKLGYSASVVFPLGIVLLACVALYLIPRTAVLGAVLLTGYLGGAVATHVRVGDPLFSHILAPLYVAALIWGGLYLRDGRVRALIGPRQS
ncbi:MAG TPA: DoxX family protein [Polyangia bacterium]|nr:DoxX family protein [Polyangia bacterium]